MKYLQTSRMSPRTRRAVGWLGMTGTIARGLVFALVGVLVIDAAVTHKAAESGGYPETESNAITVLMPFCLPRISSVACSGG